MLDTPFSPWPSFSKKESDIVKKVLLSNKVNYWTGSECRKFEDEFASFAESKFAIAVANGTLALDLALKALNIDSGDEVIVTSRTYLASATSIVNIGAKPVFVDVCLKTQNILPEKIKAAITSKTKAIICVHLAGWPCEMDEIIEIADKKNLYIIEDCAQAHGARFKGKSVGSIGDIGCWSFCQDKIMSTGGEGGMVTTNNKRFWEKMWSYKDHGKSYDAVYKKNHPPGFRWLHESFGTNWRMTEIQGAIGRYQLTKMSEWTTKRNENQNSIWDACKKFKSLTVPDFDTSKKSTHAAYKAYVFVNNKELKANWSRDKIIHEITKLNVPCYSGSCSEVYLEKAFENTDFIPSKRLQNAKLLGETSLMFLVHPTLKKAEIEKTCKAIIKVMTIAEK
tara:strand:+ start:7897 stop:9078 length:1182 start_codon:yes stop_codon:yes gene_type:complete